jgi:hypothetical protein
MHERRPTTHPLFRLTLRGGLFDEYHGLPLALRSAFPHLERAVERAVAEAWRAENDVESRQDLFSPRDVALRMRELSDNCASYTVELYKRPQPVTRRGLRSDEAAALEADRTFARHLEQVSGAFVELLSDCADPDNAVVESGLPSEVVTALASFLKPQLELSPEDEPFCSRPVSAIWRSASAASTRVASFDRAVVPRLEEVARRSLVTRRRWEAFVGRVCRIDLRDPAGGLTLLLREGERKVELPLRSLDLVQLQRSQDAESRSDAGAPLVKVRAEVERTNGGRLVRVHEVDERLSWVGGPRLDERLHELQAAVELWGEVAHRDAMQAVEQVVPKKRHLDEAVSLAWRLVEACELGARPFLTIPSDGAVTLEWDDGDRTLQVAWRADVCVEAAWIDLGARRVEHHRTPMPEGSLVHGRLAFEWAVVPLAEWVSQRWGR